MDTGSDSLDMSQAPPPMWMGGQLHPESADCSCEVCFWEREHRKEEAYSLLAASNFEWIASLRWRMFTVFNKLPKELRDAIWDTRIKADLDFDHRDYVFLTPVGKDFYDRHIKLYACCYPRDGALRRTSRESLEAVERMTRIIEAAYKSFRQQAEQLPLMAAMNYIWLPSGNVDMSHLSLHEGYCMMACEPMLANPGHDISAHCAWWTPRESDGLEGLQNRLDLWDKLDGVTSWDIASSGADATQIWEHETSPGYFNKEPDKEHCYGLSRATGLADVGNHGNFTHVFDTKRREERAMDMWHAEPRFRGGGRVRGRLAWPEREKKKLIR